MCRWLMYHGDKIKMSDLLVDPENSLIHQSIHSSQGAVLVNGDGFGIGVVYNACTKNQEFIKILFQLGIIKT